MTAKISQRYVLQANRLLEKLRKLEEVHEKFKSGTALSWRDATFLIPDRYQVGTKLSQQYLSSALNDIGIDGDMASVMVLALFAHEADKLVKATRAELEKLGVGLD